MKIDSKNYEVRIWYSPEPGDECYIAQVPDMPGIMAHGDTREQAAHEIQVALGLALQTYKDMGEAPPHPGSYAASALGRLGGRAKTRRKLVAARRNGAKGGRPRKVLVHS